MKMLQKIFCILFGLMGISIGQNNGWSEPVPIDSTRQFYWPLIAVSPEGQIATIGFGGSLYISDDNGKSFQLRYEFKPPVQYYHIFAPNGLAYDSNSILWVYWAWNECDDEFCQFYTQRKNYLSRSTDGGNTFEHVLQFDAGFSLQIWGPANPVMYIEENNTIHFLRDSSWYNGSFTEFYLIYNKIPNGNFTKRIEVPLPVVPDSLEITGIFFIIPSDGRPFCLLPTYNRSGSNTYYFFTKYLNDEFSALELLDSLRNDEIINVSAVHILPLNSDTLYLFYRNHFLNTGELQYNLQISGDNGITFKKLANIIEEAFYTNLLDSNFLYAIDWVYRRQGIMYYKFNDIFSAPTDSSYLGNYFYPISYIDQNGGKNVIVENSQHKSFFIGKDIVTSVKVDEDENPNKKKSMDIDLNVNPNPFNNSVVISFTLPKDGRVDITLFDINGSKVKEIQSYNANSGENKISFKADNLASGAYFVVLHYNNLTYTTKALLVK